MMTIAKCSAVADKHGDKIRALLSKIRAMLGPTATEDDVATVILLAQNKEDLGPSEFAR